MHLEGLGMEETSTGILPLRRVGREYTCDCITRLQGDDGSAYVFVHLVFVKKNPRPKANLRPGREMQPVTGRMERSAVEVVGPRDMVVGPCAPEVVRWKETRTGILLERIGLPMGRQSIPRHQYPQLTQGANAPK